MFSLFLIAVALSAPPVSESSGAGAPSVAADREAVSRAALAPDPHRNVRESAHVLSQGELLVGTDGVAVGMLPAVQVSTQAMLDAVGWINGGAKVEAVRGRLLSLSVQGDGGVARWGEMDGRHVDVATTASLTVAPPP